MRVQWQYQVIISGSLLQCAEACFDSDGSFYCATLWYFWFTVFWICMFTFFGAICICNHVNKKKAQVDVQYTLPPPRRTANTAEEGKAEPLSTIAIPLPSDKADDSTAAASADSSA